MTGKLTRDLTHHQHLSLLPLKLPCDLSYVSSLDLGGFNISVLVLCIPHGYLVSQDTRYVCRASVNDATAAKRDFFLFQRG